MRQIIARFVAGALLVAPLPAGAGDIKFSGMEGPTSQMRWLNFVMERLRGAQDSDVDQLERVCDRFTREKTRDLDGRWSLDMYHNSFDMFVWTTKGDAAQRAYDLVDKWKARFPDSACAPLVEAGFHATLALHSLRGGFVVAIEKQQAHRELAAADALLDAAAELSARNPVWFTQKVNIAQQRGKPRAEIQRLFTDGARRHPDYFASALAIAMNLAPQRGGDWESLESFAQLATAATQSAQKQSLYARVYWYAGDVQGPSFRVLASTKAQWSRMRQGFDDLLALWPNSSWNLNAYASYACLAEDVETYARLRHRLTTRRHFPQSWASSTTMESCDARLLAESQRRALAAEAAAAVDAPLRRR